MSRLDAGFRARVANVTEALWKEKRRALFERKRATEGEIQKTEQRLREFRQTARIPEPGPLL